MNGHKANSLTELGFAIEPISNVVTDENGNRWLYKVTGKAPVYFIKMTRSGKLLAYRSKTDKVDTTINGLYGFEEHAGDLVGKRGTPTAVTSKKKQQKAA